MNKRTAIIVFICVVILGAGAAVYALRGDVRELAAQITQPSLPPAEGYIVPAATSTDPVTAPDTKPDPKPVTPPVATPPAEVNLAIPFLLQAPKQDWSDPFEDACEEASMLMVDGYYQGRTTDFGADEGTKAILAVVAFEDENYGYNKDTTSADVQHTSMAYFGYKNVEIQVANEANIKAALAAGKPVIVPAYGKALNNPNFKNGGPEYHMLVIKGYLKDGRWITNDPGTRNGRDYIYGKQLLLDAIHDFDKTGVQNGAKKMIVISK